MYRTLTAITLMSAGSLCAQAPEPPVVTTIETENHVLYRDNTTDMSRIANVQTPTSSVNIAFRPGINVADIVALNGKAARGNYSNTFVAMPYRANPSRGQPVADADGTATFHCTWQILAPDGTYLGTILESRQRCGSQSGSRCRGGKRCVFRLHGRAPNVLGDDRSISRCLDGGGPSQPAHSRRRQVSSRLPLVPEIPPVGGYYGGRTGRFPRR